MEIKKENMNFCPECGTEIEKNARNCKKCGSWFEKSEKNDVKNEYSKIQPEKTVLDVKYEHSNVQSTHKTALFIIITGGLYQLYWFYRNWRDLKTHKNLDINVGLRTVGLFIPLVNIYFVVNQFKDIKSYAEETGVKTYSLWTVLITWVLFAYLSTRLSLYGNLVAGIISWILILGLAVPFVMAQKTLNEYWIKEQGDIPPKGLSGGEILVLAIGILLAALEWIGIISLLSGA
ncbi:MULTISPECIES: hypothetical protein [Methanobacterium]|jgi:hypothetical protein|uniref:Zinc-ribbon domain-containing protein n=1 Tax=Methanobacterium bryantii TaxID=2161 RepID=A0A2A2H8R5_METBR|nr:MULTISPECIES: hypothetical protein [Methanobacterium]OEC87910.1 hypothetical protein A9507_06960 [Methanobacterium sp. A39]PAV05777.1 hypothetical protein ASJ80_08570 [Methanobacterium bryantii]